MLSMLPGECCKTRYTLGQVLLQSFCFPSSPVGHGPGGSLAVPQQNEQLKDEVHPFQLIVPILGQEILPGRALSQKKLLGNKNINKNLHRIH